MCISDSCALASRFRPRGLEQYVYFRFRDEKLVLSSLDSALSTQVSCVSRCSWPPTLDSDSPQRRSGARPGPSWVDDLRGHAKVHFPREKVPPAASSWEKEVDVLRGSPACETGVGALCNLPARAYTETCIPPHLPVHPCKGHPGLSQIVS